jgi:hypothetical protein
MQTTSAELSKLQKELTDLALQIAASQNIKLDFSLDSVKNVEKILGIIHNDYKKTKNEEGVRGIALEFAAYMISVIEKNLSVGFWERDSVDMGKDAFPYHLEGGRIIFPFSWCLKRIVDGPGDDVSAKFQAILLDK